MKSQTTRFCFLSAILVGAMLSQASAQQQFTAETLLKNSIQQIGPKHREVDNAIEAFKKARVCDGVCLEEVHYSMGLAYRSLGDFGESKRQLELAVNYHSNFAEAKVALKDVAALIGK